MFKWEQLTWWHDVEWSLLCLLYAGPSGWNKLEKSPFRGSFVIINDMATCDRKADLNNKCDHLNNIPPTRSPLQLAATCRNLQPEGWSGSSAQRPSYREDRWCRKWSGRCNPVVLGRYRRTATVPSSPLILPLRLGNHRSHWAKNPKNHSLAQYSLDGMENFTI